MPLIEGIRKQTKNRKHRRYGYRRITEILQRLGWFVNHKRIYRLWLLEGLRLPKPKKKGKGKAKGCSANACDRFPAEYLDHIWSYDIVEDKLNNGRKVRILNVIDEFGKESLASDVGFSIKAHDVVEVLRYLFAVRGCPAYLRSDNGSEFTSSVVKEFLKEAGVDTLFIEPGSPWENGYVESFNARMRDELLNGEIFLHIDETRYIVNRWRMDYNHYRPHSSLRYMTPAEFAQLCHEAGCVRPKKLLYENKEVRGNTLIKVGP